VDVGGGEADVPELVLAQKAEVAPLPAAGEASLQLRLKAGSVPAFGKRAGIASRRVKMVSIEPSVMRITGSEDRAQKSRANALPTAEAMARAVAIRFD
jgi:hypothetical protein